MRNPLSNGESIHAAFPAVPGIWEREEIYVEVSENRSYGCRYGQIRLNMRQGALRKEKPIRVSLPTVQSPEKITAMYMLNDWWTRPAFVEGFQEIPARTQVAFLKYPDRFACLVPMVGKPLRHIWKQEQSKKSAWKCCPVWMGRPRLTNRCMSLERQTHWQTRFTRCLPGLQSAWGFEHGNKGVCRKCSALSAGAAGMLLQRNHRRKSPSEGPRACGKENSCPVDADG